DQGTSGGLSQGIQRQVVIELDVVVVHRCRAGWEIEDEFKRKVADTCFDGRLSCWHLHLQLCGPGERQRENVAADVVPVADLLSQVLRGPAQALALPSL